MCEVLYQDSIAVKKFKILYNNFKYLLIYLKKKEEKGEKECINSLTQNPVSCYQMTMQLHIDEWLS